MAFPMLMILTLLAIIVSFGVGFIFNMLTKYWLTSSIIYALALIAIPIFGRTDLGAFVWFLLVVMAAGSLGSSFAIRTLQRRGFRMFT